MNDAARGNIPTQEQVKEEVEVKQPVVEPLPTQEAATTEKEDKPKGDTVTSTTEIKDGVRKTVYKKYNSDGKLTGGLRIEKEDISKTELEAIEDALDGLKDYTFELLKFNKYENGKMSGIVRVRGKLMSNGVYVANNYEFKFDKDFSGKTVEETAVAATTTPSSTAPAAPIIINFCIKKLQIFIFCLICKIFIFIICKRYSLRFFSCSR